MKHGYDRWDVAGLSARAQRDLVLRTKLRAFHVANGAPYGRPRLWNDLREDGAKPSARSPFGRLMREEAIQGQVPTRFRQTTDSNHDDAIAANLLDRDFTVGLPMIHR